MVWHGRLELDGSWCCKKSPAARGWALAGMVRGAYGNTAWVEWLPWGMDTMAVGFGPDGKGVAWAA